MNIKQITSWLIAFTFLACSQLSYADEVSSMARGGKLYDKWYTVIGAAKPDGTHPAWPASNTKKKGATTHRCKSCHGWDLMGKDGAYASGSYKTGIGGLTQLQGASNSKVIAAMKGSIHGFAGKMGEQDFNDLANFLTKGQFDIDAVIDRKSKLAKNGDSSKGESYYNTVCANCHAESGTEPAGMPALGALSHKNPWETIQKIMNGQPDAEMPAMRAFGLQVSVDILSYVQTLPKK
jgi:thiosulfate dehydrogenase